MFFRALMLPVLSVVAFAQSPVAMVTDIVGKASLRPGQFLGLTASVPAQQTITLEAGSRLVVVHLRTGEEFAFTGPAKVRFNAEGRPEGAQPSAVKKVGALQGSIRLKPEAMVQASVVMREVDPALGGRSGFTPQGPALLDPLPEFKWKSAGVDASYRLELIDSAGQSHLELTLDETSLKLPEHLALRDGARYTWRLHTTVKGETHSESGTLRTLAKTEREQLQAARPKEGASFSERLIFAALLEQLKVSDEASRQWKILAAERPQDETLRALAER